MNTFSTPISSPIKHEKKNLTTPPGVEKTKPNNMAPKRKDIIRKETNQKKSKPDNVKFYFQRFFSYEKILQVDDVEGANDKSFYFTNAVMIEDLGPFFKNQIVYPVVDFKDGNISISAVNFQREMNHPEHGDLRSEHVELFIDALNTESEEDMKSVVEDFSGSLGLMIYDKEGKLPTKESLFDVFLDIFTRGFNQDAIDNNVFDYKIKLNIETYLEKVTSVDVNNKTGKIHIHGQVYSGVFYSCEKDDTSVVCEMDLKSLKFKIKDPNSELEVLESLRFEI